MNMEMMMNSGMAQEESVAVEGEQIVQQDAAQDAARDECARNMAAFRREMEATLTARMEVFLRRLAARAGRGTKLLLVAPPPMVPGAWVGEERLLLQSARLGDRFCALARRLGIAFADAGAWNVALAFDGVHFSPEGHRAFAAGLVPVLEGLFGKPADAGERGEANGDRA